MTKETGVERMMRCLYVVKKMNRPEVKDIVLNVIARRLSKRQLISFFLENPLNALGSTPFFEVVRRKAVRKL